MKIQSTPLIRAVSAEHKNDTISFFLQILRLLEQAHRLL